MYLFIGSEIPVIMETPSLSWIYLVGSFCKAPAFDEIEVENNTLNYDNRFCYRSM